MKTSALLSLLVLLASLVLPHTAAARTTRHEDTLAYISYEGSWQTFRNNPALSEGGGSASATAGARVSLQFTGTGIVWIGYRCLCGGVARVYLDGVLHGTVDTYAATTQAQAEVYRITGLTMGVHTIAIEVTGERNSAAGNAYVGLDAFDVIDAFDLSAPGTIEIQESDEAITYTGDWMDVDHPDVSGGSVVASRTVGAEAVVRFNGTGIAWISYLCSCATGRARAYLDGGPGRAAATGWLGSPGPQYEQFRVEGLAAGDHTLRIAVTGESVGATPWVVIDSFLVTDAGTGANGDSVPPTVEVTAPETAWVRGTVPFNLQAFDNSGVDYVRFLVDGVAIGEASIGGYVAGIPWDTTDFDNGPHTLTAEATDTEGNTALSIPVTRIVDNVNPTALITSPQDNASITGNVTWTVEASDNVGLRHVRFYANDTLLAEDGDAPFVLTRDVSSVPSGRVFTLRAEAVDYAGNVGDSNSITVTVQH